jgi:sigma-E factor negative regulatory protein RseA
MRDGAGDVMDKMQTGEMISALADGQLTGDAFARGVEIATADPLAREAWLTYHLIGDVLRSGEHASGTLPGEFLDRLQLRLQQEQFPVPSAAAVPDAALVRTPDAAANDTNFRWKVVAGLASLTAMAAIGWTAAGGSPGRQEAAQLAVVPSGTVLQETQRGVMIRDARLDELLAAHRQLGGASALQMPAGFLRNATFEGPIR